MPSRGRQTSAGLRLKQSFNVNAVEAVGDTVVLMPIVALTWEPNHGPFPAPVPAPAPVRASHTGVPLTRDVAYR